MGMVNFFDPRRRGAAAHRAHRVRRQDVIESLARKCCDHGRTMLESNRSRWRRMRR
jgi:hypothetical protein